jgi:thiol-disulfide isomerase/thioredoxin
MKPRGGYSAAGEQEVQGNMQARIEQAKATMQIRHDMEARENKRLQDLEDRKSQFAYVNSQSKDARMIGGGYGHVNGMNPSKANAFDESDDSDDDMLLNDPELDKIRAKRIAGMKAAAKKRAAKAKSEGVKEYLNIVESEFLPLVTKNKMTAIHFYHKDFPKCKVMDKHMKLLSMRHGEVKFARMNAEKAPFFVEKLRVRTLPAVIFFDDGIRVGEVIGFEGLSAGKDDFRTRALEKELLRFGVIMECEEEGTWPDERGYHDDEDEDEHDW